MKEVLAETTLATSTESLVVARMKNGVPEPSVIPGTLEEAFALAICLMSIEHQRSLLPSESLESKDGVWYQTKELSEHYRQIACCNLPLLLKTTKAMTQLCARYGKYL